MKVNLHLFKWRWQNIDSEQAKRIINDYSELIDYVLKYQCLTDYESILFDLDDMQNKTTKLVYNDENGKSFLSITRAKEA